MQPSQVQDRYWIQALRRIKGAVSPPESSGKWLVFVAPESVDAMWAKIRLATAKGSLGYASKVATARPNPLGGKSRDHVNCVYTYDWNDRQDVVRIRQELKGLGITWKIPYKSDADTLAGKYRVTGHTKISKYL